MNIENELIIASKSYSEDLGQRALISNIPIIGSSIDYIFTKKWSKYYNDRLEIFNNCVIQEFETLDENKVDKEFLKSNEFFDLTLRLIENSVKTRHQEKVQLFSKLLKSRVLKNYSSNYDSDDFTNTINELIPKDIIIINAFFELSEKLKIEREKAEKPNEFFDYITIDKIIEKTDYSKSEISFSISKLIKLGLATESFESTFGMTSGGNYKATEYLNELNKILNA